MARYSEVELAAIMAELDESAPYYVPGLIEEIRHLRQELMRVVAIINSALEGRP